MTFRSQVESSLIAGNAAQVRTDQQQVGFASAQPVDGARQIAGRQNNIALVFQHLLQYQAQVRVGAEEKDGGFLLDNFLWFANHGASQKFYGFNVGFYSFLLSGRTRIVDHPITL